MNAYSGISLPENCLSCPAAQPSESGRIACMGARALRAARNLDPVKQLTSGAPMDVSEATEVVGIAMATCKGVVQLTQKNPGFGQKPAKILKSPAFTGTPERIDVKAWKYSIPVELWPRLALTPELVTIDPTPETQAAASAAKTLERTASSARITSKPLSAWQRPY